MLHLRKLLKSGIVILDLEAVNMKKICEAIEDILVTQGDMNKETALKFRNLLLMKHRHQFEGPRKVETGLTSMIKELLVKKLETSGSRSKEASLAPSRRGSAGAVPALEAGDTRQLAALDEGKVNRPFLKKLPANSCAAVVLAGRSALLARPVSIFIRLARGVVLEDLPEVDIPTRYLYFVVGAANPRKEERVTCDVGRAMASCKNKRRSPCVDINIFNCSFNIQGSAFSDNLFTELLHEADTKDDIVEALES